MIREALLQPGRQRLGGHGNTSTYWASMVFPIRGCGNRWEIKTLKIGCLNVLCKVSVLPSTRLTAARLSQFMITDGDFPLYVRAYWPKAEIVNGSWILPPVEQTK
jgi:hypothetical protein